MLTDSSSIHPSFLKQRSLNSSSVVFSPVSASVEPRAWFPCKLLGTLWQVAVEADAPARSKGTNRKPRPRVFEVHS